MKIFLVITTLLFSIQLHSQDFISLRFEIDTKSERAKISPYIYGTNQELSGKENWGAMRLGGNRLTTYNWENNASNAGSDWKHCSDNYLSEKAAIPEEYSDKPAKLLTSFYTESARNNAYPLITLQMAGYVAKDKNGEVMQNEKAPSDRWCQVFFKKNGVINSLPEVNDNKVYIDECIHFLVDKCGDAASGGIVGYSLDNEPCLWSETHPLVHPNKITCKELIDKSIDLSKAIKEIDKDAEVFGPALFGYSAFYDLHKADDWQLINKDKKYKWFIDYYLDEMHKGISDSANHRLLDVLDIHWYPEAKGDKRIVDKNANSEADMIARMQAPRSLWDKNYREKSWISEQNKEAFPLLPKLFGSINEYYPLTKLAITEINYGGENHISGGIAMADVIGILGKYGVYMANFFKLSQDNSYISSAYKIYRNYNMMKATFGDTKVKATGQDNENSSIYASVQEGDDSELHIIVINKSLTKPINGKFTLKGSSPYLSAKIWSFNKDHSEITQDQPINKIVGNTFEYQIQALSVSHIVVSSMPYLED